MPVTALARTRVVDSARGGMSRQLPLRREPMAEFSMHAAATTSTFVGARPVRPLHRRPEDRLPYPTRYSVPRDRAPGPPRGGAMKPRHRVHMSLEPVPDRIRQNRRPILRALPARGWSRKRPTDRGPRRSARPGAPRGREAAATPGHRAAAQSAHDSRSHSAAARHRAHRWRDADERRQTGDRSWARRVVPP